MENKDLLSLSPHEREKLSGVRYDLTIAGKNGNRILALSTGKKYAKKAEVCPEAIPLALALGEDRRE